MKGGIRAGHIKHVKNQVTQSKTIDAIFLTMTIRVHSMQLVRYLKPRKKVRTETIANVKIKIHMTIAIMNEKKKLEWKNLY